MKPRRCSDFGAGFLESSVEGSSPHRTAFGVREHGAGLSGLRVPGHVLDQLAHHARRKGDHPSACIGFGGVDQDALPGDLLDLPRHADRATESVDVTATKAQHFTRSETTQGSQGN